MKIAGGLGGIFIKNFCCFMGAFSRTGVVGGSCIISSSLSSSFVLLVSSCSLVFSFIRFNFLFDLGMMVLCFLGLELNENL